jgi:hypothetical protein
MDHILEAMRMLEAFVGVGAHEFDVSRTTIDKRGIPGGYLAAQSAVQLRERLPSLLEASLREQANLIIQPHICQPAGLLQLDDLSAGMLARLRPLAFLVIATSAEKRQAWVALEGCDRDFCRRMKRAAGADLGANGNVRLAGSLNVKSVYSPDFPTVRIEATLSRPRVGPEDFRALGLVAPAQAGGGVYRAPLNGKRPRAWPSYECCLAGAPATAAGEKDRSLAEFCWCCTAIRWGWSPTEAAAQLMNEPLSKAHKRAEPYAIHTARKAAAAVAGDPR